jgi:hypothetical protein
LTKGKVTIVDEADFKWLSQRRWYYHIKGYAVSTSPKPSYLMHRLILNAPKDLQVDHINGDKLDNRRCNLRLCTAVQNRMNVFSYRGTSSEFKGVSWNKRLAKWESHISLNGKRHLGFFTNEQDAAQAYNEAASRQFGEFARLNIL